MMHPIISVRCARDSFKIASGFFAVFTIALASVLCAFTGMCASEKDSGKTYIDLRNRLENGGDKIDYETLMRVYREISETPDPIPHVDRLLMSLISKRNSNPRIDQMILIFAARTIENSRYPIHNVYAIFETILNMDDERLNEWVISFVASAIGHYPFDIPHGDRLVDLLEQTMDRVESVPSESREYFGFHFLPPPKNHLIRSYLAGIADKRQRETERFYYYSLVRNHITESQIETALKRLQENGIPGTDKKCRLPMKHLFFHIYKTP